MRLIGSWKVVLLTILACASFQSNAQWTATARVTLVDPSWMGSRAGDANAAILFVIDQTITGNPCASTANAPQILFYVPINFANGTGDTGQPTGNDRQMVNSKAMLSTLQIAVVTGLRVNLFGVNGTGGYCQVTYVQLLNS